MTIGRRFFTRFRLHIRMLPATLLTAFLWHVIRRLPAIFVPYVSRPLGKYLRQVNRDALIPRMMLVLGDRGRLPALWHSLRNAYFYHVGLTVVESLQFHQRSFEELRSLIDLEGEEHLDRSLAAGRGAILFINHHGNMACVPAGLAPRSYRLAIVANAMGTRALQQRVEQILRRGAVDLLPLDNGLPARTARALSSNTLVAMAVDFTVVHKHTCQVEFGPSRIEVSLAPAIIALRNSADVLCVSTHRLPDGRHRLLVHPPLHQRNSGNLWDDARYLLQQAMTLLYQEVASRPEQWWIWDYVRPVSPQFHLPHPAMEPTSVPVRRAG